MRTAVEIAEEVALIGPRIGRRLMADLSAFADIPQAQLFVLMQLFVRGPMRTCDIGRELKVAAPTATGIIDRLETAGFIVRSEDKDDRRVVVVDLTPEGRKVAQKLRSVAVERWAEILTRLSREDAEKYLELMKKIDGAL